MPSSPPRSAPGRRAPSRTPPSGRALPSICGPSRSPASAPIPTRWASIWSTEQPTSTCTGGRHHGAMPAHRFDLDAIGAGLPVAAARPELTAAARSGAMVVTAPPGTGKTTFVPPLVADVTHQAGGDAGGPAGVGRTLVTQPRRIAVRAAARRIAVRGQRSVGTATRLELLTPGVLLRRLMSDPELRGVSAVLLDEVHERSLDTDLLLGMLAEVRTLREDLLVGAMSATVDAESVAA